MTVTESVRSPREARADFDDLEHLQCAMTFGPTGPVRLCIRRAADGETVVLATFRDEASAVILDVLAKSQEYSKIHFLVRAESFEPDFASELDGLGEGQHKITLLTPQPPDPRVTLAVEAVPLRERIPGAATSMRVSEQDFELLTRGIAESERRMLERLVPVGDASRSGELVSDAWKMVYFFPPVWSHVMLAAAFLESQGYAYQTARDAEDNDYAILTDFVTAGAEQLLERARLTVELEERYKDPSVEDLDALFHMSPDGESAPEDQVPAPEEPASEDLPSPETLRRWFGLRRKPGP